MPIAQYSFIQSFLDYLTFQKRYSQHTVISYQNDLNDFFDFSDVEFAVTKPGEITAAFVRSWLASLKEKGIESKTINRKISALKSFFKYQLKEGVVLKSPMATIVSAKAKKRLPQFVSERDTGTLFNYVEFPDDWAGKTDRLVFHLLYNTGIRQAELINLKISHIDTGNNTLKVLGKGNKERILPMSKDLSALIQSYLADKNIGLPNADKEVLLVNEKGRSLYPKYVYNLVKKYLSTVTTIDKKSPHVMRHTFATHMMNNGADINAVKDLLGHSSLASTQVYTHNTIEKLKEVYKKAHPKA